MSSDFSDVLRRCQATLRRPPAGLLADLDGTLSRIAPTPGEATVAEEIRLALARLTRQIAVVAIVTGRAALDARRLVGVDEVVYVGNHGLELADAAVTHWDPAAVVFRPTLAKALAATRSLQDEVPGTIIEDKGPTFTIHYRLARDPRNALPIILNRLEEFGSTLRITHGKMVVEVRPPVDVSKATAVERLIERFDLVGTVYLGDDWTDVDALHVVKALREARVAPERRSLGIAVAGPETPTEVLRAADVSLAGVEQVTTLLSRLASDLDADDSP